RRDRAAGSEPTRRSGEARAAGRHAPAGVARCRHPHGAGGHGRGPADRVRSDGSAERGLRAARAVALRTAQRAADERADPGAEPAVADRRDHHHRERLRISGHRLDARRRRPEPRPHARDVRVDADRGRLRPAQPRGRFPRRAARAEAAGARVTGRLRFLRSFSGAFGAGLVVFVVLVAMFGRYFAPHDPSAPIGVPLSDASSDAWLGTDFLGRDVFSRLLYGGRSVILIALAATLLAYAVGLGIGLMAGYSRSFLDPVLMRSVDVLLAFPPLLLLLILITGAGTSVGVLIIGVAIIQAPAISRIVRTATQVEAVRAYVEAAIARGERPLAILGREVLPNILAPVLV